MIGTHTILGSRSSKITDFSFLQYEAWMTVEKIHESSTALLTSTVYKGYPLKTYSDRDWIITVEGMIFNYEDKYIYEQCLQIIDCLEQRTDLKLYLKPFIENADGEFIIQLYNTQTQEYVVFNDYLGLLPFYYSITNDTAILSRTTKFHLKYLPKYRYSKQGIAELLCFTHFIGDSTLFEEIRTLDSASYIHIERKGSNFSYLVGIACDIHFISQPVFKDRQEAVSVLAAKLIESCQVRVNKLQKEGYSLFNTLSGGFDSRMVLSMLSHCDVKQLRNVTYEYIRDESKVSEAVHKHISDAWAFEKLSFNRDSVKLDIPKRLYVTDCRVNHYSTEVCYADSLFFYNQLLSRGKYAIFAGSGGDFFRYPNKRRLFGLNVTDLIKIGVYGRSISDTKKMMKLSKLDFLTKTKRYKERDVNDQLKHLYFEQILNQDMRGGVDRNRLFSYPITPLVGVEVMKVLMHHIPLEWINFKFFIDVMAEILPESLDIPIYNSPIDLKSEKSINQFDKEYPFKLPQKQKIKLLLKSIVPYSRKIEYAHTEELMDLYNKYNNSEASQIFNIDFLKKNIEKFGYKQNLIISLMMYFYQLEQEKIKENV